MEPPVSLPVATGANPPATAAADPELEPPATLSRFHGFLVGPKTENSPVGP